MGTGAKRQAAALLEVLGVYLAGALLNDRIVALVTQHHLISSQSPFDLLTVHASNTDLLVASRQLALAFFFIYFSFFCHHCSARLVARATGASYIWAHAGWSLH